MYIKRNAEEIFSAANLAVSVKLFDNLIDITIKDIAELFSVSEKQLHFWKDRLLTEGPEIFLAFKPGKKKQAFSSLDEKQRLLVYETVNHLLAEGQKQGGKYQKFPPEFKEKILRERERLKKDHELTYKDFSRLIKISLRSIGLWAHELREKGPEGLKDGSRAPKHNANELDPLLIKEIVSYGTWWKKKRRRIKLVEFAASFRWKYRNILAASGKSNLSNNTIARYLKKHELYIEKEEAPKGKRGNFKYYFPGAQVFIDTVVIRFLWIKAKVIVVLDAVSRSVLHQEGFLKETASKVIKSLEASFRRAERLGIKVLSVVSDHGKPYKANKVWEYLKGKGVLRIFAHPYWPYDKAGIERYNRTLREALSDTWEVWTAFIRGILIWINETVLNFILIGINGEYEKKKGTDGKSPRERLNKNVNPEYERAIEKVLKYKEEESRVKNEIIGILCKEFDFGSSTVKVKNHLFGYRKEIIQESAMVLRRKQVFTQFSPAQRWAYFSTVLDNKEKERKEAELRRAKEVIRQEEIKNKEKEERQKILEERRWRDSHPEEVLDEAIEWKLAMWNNSFTQVHYDKLIIDNSKKILMKHSLVTASLKVNKLCKRIEEKNNLGNNNVLKQGYCLPSGNELTIAKEKVMGLIHRAYSECKADIPVFQGLKTFL